MTAGPLNRFGKMNKEISSICTSVAEEEAQELYPVGGLLRTLTWEPKGSQERLWQVLPSSLGICAITLLMVLCLK